MHRKFLFTAASAALLAGWSPAANGQDLYSGFTRLDPENRTLIQVSMADIAAADEMFRVLMGDKVEPRREFIEKHALDVRNLDV